MAGGGYIDGGLILQPHSLVSVEEARECGLPLLPIDAFDFLVERSGMRQVEKPFVIGPDKGRKDKNIRLARILGCDHASAKKTRDRTGTGRAEVDIPDWVIENIRANNLNPITIDDEIRTGSTMVGIAEGLGDLPLRIYAVKGFFAGCAVRDMQRENIQTITVTDAVSHHEDVGPIRHKLQVLSLKHELLAFIDHVRLNLVDPDNERWLRDLDPNECLLKLDMPGEV